MLKQTSAEEVDKSLKDASDRLTCVIVILCSQHTESIRTLICRSPQHRPRAACRLSHMAFQDKRQTVLMIQDTGTAAHKRHFLLGRTMMSDAKIKGYSVEHH